MLFRLPTLSSLSLSSRFHTNLQLTSDLIHFLFFPTLKARFYDASMNIFLLPSFGFPPNFHVQFSVMSKRFFLFDTKAENKQEEKILPSSSDCTHSFHVETAAEMWWANDGKWCLKTFPSTTINLDHEYRWTISYTACSFCQRYKLTLGKIFPLLPSRFMSLVFVSQTCFFERKICGTNKWEKFSPFFASLTPSSAFVLMLFMIPSLPRFSYFLFFFLTTKNLFQITWCCFDDGEWRNRRFFLHLFSIFFRAFDYGRNKKKYREKRKQKGGKKLWCGEIFRETPDVVDCRRLSFAMDKTNLETFKIWSFKISVIKI